MDRLTKREIEELRKRLQGHYWPDKNNRHQMIDALCDLALQSLSQEAVRDEALAAFEEGYAVLADITNQWEGRHTIEGQKLLCKMRDAIASATGRSAEDVQDNPIALRREPNAAGEEIGKEPSRASGDMPAPAAPDVASMVKRLKDRGRELFGSTLITAQDDGHLMFDAAALLAKLGQAQSRFVVNWTTEGCPKHDGQPWSFTASVYTEIAKRCPLCEPLPGASDD